MVPQRSRCNMCIVSASAYAWLATSKTTLMSTYPFAVSCLEQQLQTDIKAKQDLIGEEQVCWVRANSTRMHVMRLEFGCLPSDPGGAYAYACTCCFYNKCCVIVESLAHSHEHIEKYLEQVQCLERAANEHDCQQADLKSQLQAKLCPD